MNTRDFKSYIKSQMNALTCIELSKNIKDAEKIEHMDYLLKNMEFMIKSYREQIAHETIDSIIDKYHTSIIDQNPSETGHTVRTRLTELDEMEEKYVRLLEQCKEKASKLQEKKQVIQEMKDLDKKRKDEEAAKQKKVEKLKKIAIETAVCELFRFTPNELGSRNYVSKQVICDLLGLDCTSQKDMRYLSNILKDYGVVYDRFKTQDKVKGCFQFLRLK